jgi:hypothetical protein
VQLRQCRNLNKTIGAGAVAKRYVIGHKNVVEPGFGDLRDGLLALLPIEFPEITGCC